MISYGGNSTAGLPTATNNLGGPYKGYSPQQSISNYKDGEQTNMRRVLVKAWNTSYATGKVNNHKRVITPFRAVNNSGDFLARNDYVCGGPNGVTPDRYKRPSNIRSIISQCDQTGVPASSCNGKFVADSSDYTKYRKQKACNQNYNDLKFGGYNNSAYVNIMAVRRF
jgi:hypothetical protein